MAGQCPVHPPTHPHVTLGRDAQGLGVGADSMEEKDAMKSYHNKSMAGICMHKIILALSLKSNRMFGKRSPIHGQRDARLRPAGGAKEEREGHSQVTTQSQLEGALRTKQERRNHVYSGLLGAMQRTHGGQMARRHHWSKRTGEADMSDTQQLCQGTGSSQPGTPLLGVPEESASATIHHCR